MKAKSEAVEAILERMEGLIRQKEGENDELREKLELIEDRERWGWCQHEELPKEQILPVPRLELVLRDGSGGYERTWLYRMVYRHMLGHCVAVPLGQTRQGGGNAQVTAENILRFIPLRDGAHLKHDRDLFGWPAFMIADGVCTKIPASFA